MTASTRRGHLFRPGVSLAGRLEVRQGWASELNEIADTYVRDADNGLSRQRFEADIMHLRAFMNFGFGSYFWEEPVRSYGPGFRVAHAQKSLSLVLKHYWCNDVVEEPPACPVDRRILVIAGARTSEARWTDIDSLDAYRGKLAILDKAAAASPLGPISLAEWELEAFV